MEKLSGLLEAVTPRRLLYALGFLLVVSLALNLFLYREAQSAIPPQNSIRCHRPADCPAGYVCCDASSRTSPLLTGYCAPEEACKRRYP